MGSFYLFYDLIEINLSILNFCKNTIPNK